MNKHEKSPCCQGTVLRFGGRRRQCRVCTKTWSVWQRKRGRRAVRVSVDLAHRFVRGRLLPIRAERSGHRQTKNERAYRLAKSRIRCARHCAWPSPPKYGPLIAIADGLIKYVEGRWHTWYIILVRHRNGDTAIALPAYHRIGTETAIGWKQAFDAVPSSIMSRIVALVCDGRNALVYEAKWRGWLLQRCHFHLIARLQSRRSKWKLSRHYEEGRLIYTLVKQVLTEPDETVLEPMLNTLEEISWTNTSPEVRRVLSGFVNRCSEFRTYLAHPELGLPTTNNTAETLIGLIEETTRRSRGFASTAIIDEWISVIIKTRGAIKCRGRNQQN